MARHESAVGFHHHGDGAIDDDMARGGAAEGSIAQDGSSPVARVDELAAL